MAKEGNNYGWRKIRRKYRWEFKRYYSRKINLTKKGKTAILVHSYRHISPTTRYGYSSSICTPKGYFTKIYRTTYSYSKLKKLVKFNSNSLFIQAMKNQYGSIIQIFKVDNIDLENKKVTLKQVALFKDNRWDNTEYIKNFKTAIKSTSMRAKKYYNMTDIK